MWRSTRRRTRRRKKRRRRRGEKKKKRIEMRLMPRLLFEKDENHTCHSANLKKKLSSDWSIFMHVVCISIWFTFARRHNLVMTNPSRICRNQNNIMSNTPLFCITLANIDLLQVRRKPRNNMTDMRKVGSKPSFHPRTELNMCFRFRTKVPNSRRAIFYLFTMNDDNIRSFVYKFQRTGTGAIWNPGGGSWGALQQAVKNNQTYQPKHWKRKYRQLTHITKRYTGNCRMWIC